MSFLEKKFRHSPHVVGRLIDDEVVIVPVSGDIAQKNAIFNLEHTAARIWEMLDGERCVKDILEDIVTTMEVTPQKAQEDLISFLNDLHNEGTIEEVKETIA